MKAEMRIAFFTDSYLEVNGVAHTSRQLTAYARRRELPCLCVHAGTGDGQSAAQLIQEGSLRRLELPRTKFGFALDADLRFDLLMMRHAGLALKTVREFKPDVVHLTGPSDIGLLGLYVARKLKLPIVMSWHTNVHEYARQRMEKLLPFLPDISQFSLAGSAERASLKLALLFYKPGKVFLAPNEELGEMLRLNLNRPVFMMRRGVDTDLFSPAKRERKDSLFNIGYVGRLTAEKNVRMLADIKNGLIETGAKDFRFVIVGQGSEREFLEHQMLKVGEAGNVEFTGVLKGESLARVYANMDLFVFPSQTDTFGNVVLEAQASGVPAIVTDQGGPKFIIQDGKTGFVAKDKRGFLRAAIELTSEPELHHQMRIAARDLACRASWDAVFDEVYQAYDVCLQRAMAEQAIRQPSQGSSVRSDVIGQE